MCKLLFAAQVMILHLYTQKRGFVVENIQFPNRSNVADQEHRHLSRHCVKEHFNLSECGVCPSEKPLHVVFLKLNLLFAFAPSSCCALFCLQMFVGSCMGCACHFTNSVCWMLFWLLLMFDGKWIFISDSRLKIIVSIACDMSEVEHA